ELPPTRRKSRPALAPAGLAPSAYRKEMARLHGGNHLQLLKSRNLRRSRDLRMFNAQSEIVATVRGFHLRFPRRLLGFGKSVQRHLHALVSNRMKAKLEARQHA